jgi:hypothetical protein
VTFLNPTEPCFTFTGGTASGSCTSALALAPPRTGHFSPPLKTP